MKAEIYFIAIQNGLGRGQFFSKSKMCQYPGMLCYILWIQKCIFNACRLQFAQFYTKPLRYEDWGAVGADGGGCGRMSLSPLGMGSGEGAVPPSSENFWTLYLDIVLWSILRCFKKFIFPSSRAIFLCTQERLGGLAVWLEDDVIERR